MRPEPLRSAALRGALWITLIALIATGFALTLQYFQTTRVLETRRHAAVDDEASGLIERYRNEGVSGVAGAIRAQQQVLRIHEFFYLLTLPDGTPLVGNLLAWPAEVGTTGFHSFATQVTNTRGLSSRRWVEARAVLLEGGFRLLVGDFADERSSLRERYLASLFWSLLATGLLGLLLGWWYSRRGLTFVDIVSEVGERFLAGDLTQRLPISARADEYDRLAETINQTFAEVERLVGSLRAATDGMAHDLKTPLTRIRARLELAELGDNSRETLLRAAEETRHDLETLLRLIDDTLDLARAEATSAAAFLPVALDQVAGEVLELYQPLAEEKRLTIEAMLAPATVTGSRTLLAQIIANLLDNAIKYTPEGGTVRISLESGSEGVLLTVADSGIGIPADQRGAALMRFGRLDQSRSTPGSGIGLSIVEVVTRIHNASLRLLDNEPGLRVEVLFPGADAFPLPR